MGRVTVILCFDSLSFSRCSKLGCALSLSRIRITTPLLEVFAYPRASRAMAMVCRGPATKVVTQQPSHSCVQSSSSSSSQRIALLPSCNFAVLRISSSKSTKPRRGDAMVVRMGIRAVESFEATFQLTPESDQLLRSMLMSESFNKQVARDCALNELVKPEFSGEVFQPVPWSQTTKHGMLPEYEKYYHDSDNYVIVNVPPQIMFKAKIFKPSRLCAIFKKVSSSA